MNVRSALVKYVRQCCINAGAAPVNPTEDSRYHTYFKQCTAKRGLQRMHKPWPEACPMGWMGQLFHKHFKLDKERLPPRSFGVTVALAKCCLQAGLRHGGNVKVPQILNSDDMACQPLLPYCLHGGKAIHMQQTPYNYNLHMWQHFKGPDEHCTLPT